MVNRPTDPATHLADFVWKKIDPLSRITNAVWRWIDPVVAAVYNRGLTRARRSK